MKKCFCGLLLAASLILVGCQKPADPAPTTPPAGGGNSSAVTPTTTAANTEAPAVDDSNLVLVSLSVPNMH
jgi:uncharacterized lipoprotein YajG